MTARNYEYEIWLISIGAAKGDIAELRAEQNASLGAAAAEPEPGAAPWYANITEAMIERASRRPADRSYASRGDLLGPSQSISMSDRFQGGTDYGALLNHGVQKK
jgi:hypothetical protein